MARGWESKSVEDQQALYAESRSDSAKKLSSSELAKRSVKAGLTLKRKHVADQLQAAKNSHHKGMLELALSHLDDEIMRLG